MRQSGPRRRASGLLSTVFIPQPTFALESVDKICRARRNILLLAPLNVHLIGFCFISTAVANGGRRDEDVSRRRK